ncbi:hypothetical protein BC830DRAFT_1167833 [Chytriomyces sp. MP71]|nr:hypothetical protein BC830DRAFT_1167833 [Chytriomyces sp. MP71]
MLLAAILTATLFGFQVSGHGVATFPIIRPLPGDQQQGFTYLKGAVNVNLPPHPDYDIACNYLPPGPVFTQTLAPGPLLVDYTITAFHLGGCTVYISLDNQASCPLSTPPMSTPVGATKASGHIPVTLPPVPTGKMSYNAIIRWQYVANNGGQPANEEFDSCSDVIVSTSGSNVHSFYDILPTSSATTDSILPKTPWQFYSSSCSPVGSKLCSTDPNFINHCVYLAPSGTWNGASAYYEYACPHGQTCVSVDGVNDYCGTPGGPTPPPSPSPSTTTAVSPSVSSSPVTSVSRSSSVSQSPFTTLSKTKTTTSTTTATTGTVKPSTSSKLPGGVANSVPCTNFGSYACANGCQCAYGAGNVLLWSCNPASTTC